MVIILMGVSGAGKSLIGERLSAALGWPFLEGDTFHPPANVARMRRGIPLTDADREPWLDALNARIRAERDAGHSLIVASSALKQQYRERLARGVPEVRFVWLTGDRAILRERLDARRGHFMPPALLDSQLATLEPPADALRIDVRESPDTIVRTIRESLEI